jgi:uncharacterized membrane protein
VVAQASSLRWRHALQCAVFPAQIVVTLEKLHLPIKSCPALSEIARLVMQRRNLLPNSTVEALQERGRDLLELDRFFYAEDYPSAH